MALTQKKRHFADALLSGMTQKDAAIFAKYSAATAAQAGSRLAKDSDVVAYMARQRSDSPTPQHAKNIVDAVKSTLNNVANNVNQRAGAEGLQFGGAKFTYSDPRDYLMHVMNDIREDSKTRFDAAKTLMPYHHGKVADQGKKDAQKDRAKQAGSVFGVGAAPKLVVNNK